MSPALRLSFGGEVPDDFVVIENDREIGRIRLGDAAGGTQEWFWSITVPLSMVGRCNGREPTREEAQDQFMKAWTRFRSGLTDQQVAHWHHIQDASETKKSRRPGGHRG